MIKIEDNQFIGKEIDASNDNKLKKQNFHLTLGNYLEAHPECQILNFGAIDNNLHAADIDELVVGVRPIHDNFVNVRTGNYIGELEWSGIKFNITSRFGDKFLRRMLNVADNVFLSDVNALSQEQERHANSNLSQYILHYLFVQSLERSHVLGLPKKYETKRQSSNNFKGRLDIPEYIRTAIPYAGLLPTSTRELVEIHAIANVLWKALQIVNRPTKKSKPRNNNERNSTHLFGRIPSIIQNLNEVNADAPWKPENLLLAKNSKALLNPVFAPYKPTLQYAEWIIKSDSLRKSDNGKNLPRLNFLINVAELFEIYIRKLLQRHFPDWVIASPKLELHPRTFFARKIIPDIVMERGTDVAIFDTKYKRMNFAKRSQYGAGDLDREDYFQINTYMAYYAQHANKNLLGGGLIYPLESEYPKCITQVQDGWFGHENSPFFIVDGIDLSNSDGSIETSESRFIDRLRDLLRTSST